MRLRALKGHLNIYYDAVIASIRGAESIWIFGPGEAKGELENPSRGSTSADVLSALKRWTR
jgi:hypothetical protein